MPLPPAIDAEVKTFYGENSTFMTYYQDTSGEGRPLVLFHSINAGASSYEVRPIFEYYRGKRPVFALDLPGFGHSERSDRPYSAELYQNAMLDFIRLVVGQSADVIALSLSSEFLAAATLQSADCFNSITLISPSGFSQDESKVGSQRAADNQNSQQVYRLLSNPLWAQGFFDLLATRPSIRYFLKQSFYGEPPQGLVDYGYKTTNQPGARYAPLYFVSGQLFTPDIRQCGFAKVEVPALVLYDQDNFTTFDTLPTLVADKTNWHAVRIPNTMGLPHFERMPEVAEALENFWT